MKVIATNKKAFRNFHLLQSWECGIILNGAEVKSIRAGQVNFKDTFARFDENEIWLYNLDIQPYTEASYHNKDADRPRKLLMHKKEMKKLFAQIQQKRLALVPTKIYFTKRGLVKVELALAQGKKLYDKREDIKKRDVNIAIHRALRHKR